MHLHEYQSKQIFSQYGIPIPKGELIDNSSDIDKALAALGGGRVVVKAQVHAGGRGKAGGVKKADSLQAVEEIAAGMLGTRLVTHQSGADGQPVDTVLIEAASTIQRELYLSMLIDRSKRRVSVIVSSAGGMDIEEVAATQPEKIITRSIHPVVGLQACKAHPR